MGAYKNDPMKRKARYTWHNMKTRCYNPQNRQYPRYGGRGIALCDEWFPSFIPFYEWSMRNGMAEGLTIDRIDNDGNYCPENCRWVDQKTQANNTSLCHYVEFGGEKKTIQQWAESVGISHQAMDSRLQSSSWTLEEALTLKAHERPVQFPTLRKAVIQLTKDGKEIREWASISEAMSYTGIPTSNLVRALKNPKYTARGYYWRYQMKGEL